MTVVAVLPIKQLADAKQRLAPLLSAEERRGIFTAMVEDVLTTAEASEVVDRILVVTSDAAVAELAGGYGADLMPEPDEPGMIEAVTEAGVKLAQEGVRVMLFLPGDVPLATPEELAVAVEGLGESGGPEALIVPAADLGGTNGFACSPPDCMTFGFGEDSFRRHLALAAECGISPAVARLPGLGLDIDTPSDLRELVAMAEREGRDCHTMRYMASRGIIARLATEPASGTG